MTTVVDEKDVSKVQVLARSLKLAMTSKKLVVVMSPTLDYKIRFEIFRDFTVINVSIISTLSDQGGVKIVIKL